LARYWPWLAGRLISRPLGSVAAPKEVHLTKSRLEAFSDAVIAIIMTIMVLELRPPSGSTLASLATLAPKFLTYALSFLYLAMYWNNHHHLFQAVQRVNGVVPWANIQLICWLSLVPFVTAWAGDHPTVSLPVATYGAVLILAAFAYYLLVRALPPSMHATQFSRGRLEMTLKGRSPS